MCLAGSKRSDMTEAVPGMPTAPPLRKLARKVRTLVQLPLGLKLVLVPVYMVLVLSSLAIATIPFRRLAPVLGTHMGGVGIVPLASAVQERRAMLLRAAITLAAGYAPVRADCYPQALAAVLMCRVLRLPYALHFGATPRDATPSRPGMIAHAWAVCGRVPLTGGRSFGRCAVLACYLGPRRTGAQALSR